MEDYFASIIRSPETKSPILSVTRNTAWTLYAGKDTSSVDTVRPILSGNRAGNFPVPSGIRSWTCFAFESEKGKLFLAERQLPMTGGFNYRDLGGLPGAKGKRVAWGKFFRADDPSGLSDADRTYLSTIPLTSIVDFRTPQEAAAAPWQLPASVKNLYTYPIIPGRMNGGHIPTASLEVEEFMLSIYQDFALNERITETYKRFFALVQDKTSLPLLFHCSAGKDRTGMAAALILSALGVPREIMLQDYTASNRYLAGKYSDKISKKPERTGLYSVKPTYLTKTFALLEEMYGSIERYLTVKLDVDIPKMHNTFLT